MITYLVLCKNAMMTAQTGPNSALRASSSTHKDRIRLPGDQRVNNRIYMVNNRLIT